MAAGHAVKKTVFGAVGKRRISDRKPLKKANVFGKDKTAFREMAQRQYPEIKGRLSERLAECLTPRFGLNAGEQLFEALNVLKQAYSKSTGQDAKNIKNHIGATQTRLNSWMNAHPGEPIRRKP